MKIAAAQSTVSRDPAENGESIRAQMREAAAAGARLVQFPEGALSGYPLKETDTGWDSVDREMTAIAALAGELRIWAVVGCSHRLSPQRPYNSLYAISDEGRIAARYDKQRCSNNEITNIYSSGFEPVVFEADGFRFGMTLCIEINFPELFMEYERRGVDCVLFSSHSKDPMFGVIAQGHAAANNLWIGVSVPAQFADVMPSGVIGPDGYWMGQCVARREATVLVVELDRSDARFDVALNKARPWRRLAREGSIYRRGRNGK